MSAAGSKRESMLERARAKNRYSKITREERQKFRERATKHAKTVCERKEDGANRVCEKDSLARTLAREQESERVRERA